ncbi:MAG TPA: hypothetical protein VKS22_13360 [Candidatus Binataceae bacterium]|nr:hypothetical protein [Candidatus Binataceae bacterium]
METGVEWKITGAPGRAAAVLLLLVVFTVTAYSLENQQAAAGITLERMARAQFGTLSAAEVVMLHTAPTRAVAWASPSQDPNAPINDPSKAASWGPERTIRAEIIEWLLSDAQASRVVHPSGLGVKGARITGKLDFSYLTITSPIMLVLCAIGDGIDLQYAHYQSLDLRSSFTGPIVGDLSVSQGDVLLRYGHYDGVSFYRAEIGGNLEANGGQFAGDEPLSVVDATIKGDALFHEDFTANGVVDFRLARIGRGLSFNHARFTGASDNGLEAERATVGGTLYWVAITQTPRTQLDLSDAHVGALWDDEQSWPAPGKLALDGFVYGEFSGGPADSASRLVWLRRQSRALQSNPQPYRQLAEVMRAEGRPEGAINVEMARQDALTAKETHFGPRVWRLALKWVLGYGYRPLRALWWILLFVVFGTVLFGWGYHARIITPTNERAYEVFVQTGAPPPYYPPFSSFVYSLENFLPVVELHQGQYWRPNPLHMPTASSAPRWVSATFGARILRWYLWVHILAGWTITPLLFAGLAGLLRND